MYPTVEGEEVLEAVERGVRLIFMRGHTSLAFKGPNVVLGLYTCNYSSAGEKELGAAAGWKQVPAG